MRLTTISFLLLPALVRAEVITSALVASSTAVPVVAQTSISTPSPAADIISSIPFPEPTTQSQLQPPQPPSEEQKEPAAPQISLPPEQEQLELRAIVDPNAAAEPTQANPMTTMWVQTVLKGGVTTYVEIVFSQTFAAVPTQAPSPAAGNVGMGTLTGKIGVVKTESASSANSHHIRSSLSLFSLRGDGLLGSLVAVGLGIAVGVVWML